MIGNPTGFNGLPCPSMSNDNLFWRLLGLVSGYLTWRVNRKTYTLRTNRRSLTICPDRNREYNDQSCQITKDKSKGNAETTNRMTEIAINIARDKLSINDDITRETLLTKLFSNNIRGTVKT